MFSNVTKVMSILLTTSATNALVERPNFALHFIKTDYRNTMSEDHFNALVLLYVHWDIKLDYNRIIQIYANKYPRRLLLINPLLESWKSLICKVRTLCFVYLFMFIIVTTLTSFFFNAFFSKRFNMLNQCLVPSITKKVSSYLLLLGEQTLIIALQIQNFH